MEFKNSWRIVTIILFYSFLLKHKTKRCSVSLFHLMSQVFLCKPKNWDVIWYQDTLTSQFQINIQRLNFLSVGYSEDYG